MIVDLVKCRRLTLGQKVHDGVEEARFQPLARIRGERGTQIIVALRGVDEKPCLVEALPEEPPGGLLLLLRMQAERRVHFGIGVQQLHTEVTVTRIPRRLKQKPRMEDRTRITFVLFMGVAAARIPGKWNVGKGRDLNVNAGLHPFESL